MVIMNHDKSRHIHQGRKMTQCPITAAEDAARATIEANDARIAAIAEELHHAMTQGLAGFAAGVPSYRLAYDHRTFGEKVETTQTAADAVLEALQSLEPIHALMMCLKDSACPLVAKLRAEVVKQYVADNAEGIDAARGFR